MDDVFEMWVLVILSSQTLPTRAEEMLATVAELTYEVRRRDGCFLTVARVGVNDENMKLALCV